MNRPFRSRIALAALALPCCTGPAWAEPPAATPAASAAPAATLPDGMAVHARFIEAIGGRDAYLKLTRRTAKGRFEVIGAGVKGTLTLYQAAPNSSAMEIDIPGIGTVRQGTDGAVAWETSAIQGPRLLDGDEGAEALRSARFHLELEPDKYFKSIVTLGQEDVKGRPAFVVEYTPEKGPPRKRFFDAETGLLLKETMTLKTAQMGEQKVESFSEDYKVVDGIKMAHTTRQKILMFEQVITLDSVDHQAEIPPDKLAVPDDVKPLIEKQKAAPKIEAPKPAGG